MNIENYELRKKNYGFGLSDGNTQGSAAINNAQNELASIMSNLSATQADKTQEQTQIAQNDAQQQSQLSSIQGNLQSALVGIATATASVQSATSNLASANSAVSSAQSALGSANSEDENYAALAAQLSEALAAQAQAQAELNAAQQELTNANSVKDQVQQALEGLQQEIEQSKSTNDAELLTLDQTIQDYQTQVQSLEAEIQQLQQEQQQAQAQAETDQKEATEDENLNYQNVDGKVSYKDLSGQEVAKLIQASAPAQTVYNSDGSVTKVYRAADGSEVTTTQKIENGKVVTVDDKTGTQINSYGAAVQAEETEQANDLAQAAQNKEHTFSTTAQKHKDVDGNNDGLDSANASSAYNTIKQHEGYFVGEYDSNASTACIVDGIERIVGNTEWKINVNGEDKSLVDAIVDSYDSELDLYIDAKVKEIIAKDGARGATTALQNYGFLSEDALRELAALGIRADAIGDADGNFTNRVYSFSLIDTSECPEGVDKYEWMYNTEEGKKAKVITDDAGNEGSIILSDCVIPDGYYQGAEVEFSSILDLMGADMLTKADFIGREDEYEALINDVESRLKAGTYHTGQSMDDLYGNRKDVQQSRYDLFHGGASYLPGIWGSGAGKANTAEGMADEFAQYLKDLEDGIASDDMEADGKSSSSSANYKKILEAYKEQYKKDNGVEASGSELRKLVDKAEEEYKKSKN